MDRSREPDAELVRAAGNGDRAAGVALFDRYVATVTRYAWALVPSRQDVEEVVQDTFVTLWRRAGTVELPDESILPWLLVVSRNHAANLRRSHRRHQGDDLPDDLPATVEDDDARDRLRWVSTEEVDNLFLAMGSTSEATLDERLGADEQAGWTCTDRLGGRACHHSESSDHYGDRLETTHTFFVRGDTWISVTQTNTPTDGLLDLLVRQTWR